MRKGLRYVLGVAVLLGGGTFAIPSPAQDQERKNDERKVERVIILSDGGKRERGADRQLRTIEIDGARRVRCGRRMEVDERGKDERERTRIVLCGDGLSAAGRAEELEKVLNRIRGNDELSPEHKARIEAKLREAIDRLREAR